MKYRTGSFQYHYCYTGIREFNGGFIDYAINKISIKTLFIEWLQIHSPNKYK